MGHTGRAGKSTSAPATTAAQSWWVTWLQDEDGHVEWKNKKQESESRAEEEERHQEAEQQGTEQESGVQAQAVWPTVFILLQDTT